MAEVVFDHVTKEFPGGTLALRDLSLEVGDGEFLILVGPSGCGKTTALRLLAGLERLTSGTLSIDGRVINDVTPRDRDIAMVFQNYALYPHMTVAKNLAFGLKQRRAPKGEIDRRVREISEMLGLDDLMKRRPAQLSGGQRQRVAMGRALVREPKAFLLDEPLSNLDAKLRVQMRAELKRLHQTLGITTIYVTHDQTEAMTLGDRIVVMSAGELQQIGGPQEVYDEPKNLFVAAFIGSPSMNLLRGVWHGGTVRAGDLEIALPGAHEGEIVLGIRPEHFHPGGGDGQPSLDFQVDVVEPLGDETLVHGSVAGQLAQAEVEQREHLLAVPETRATVTARFEARHRPVVGERIPLGVNVDEIHLFDSASGRAIR